MFFNLFYTQTITLKELFNFTKDEEEKEPEGDEPSWLKKLMNKLDQLTPEPVEQQKEKEIPIPPAPKTKPEEQQQEEEEQQQQEQKKEKNPLSKMWDFLM